MEIHVNDSDGRRRLALAGELTIYAAAAVKAPLLAPLADADAIDIDLAGVSEIDTAGVQLLLLARREAEAAGKRLAFAAPSAAVAELAALYGLDGFAGTAAIEAGETP
jgi:anti-sigma B factor antagonist